MSAGRVTPQPYFPEPIEVPGNAAAGPYSERVSFVRAVCLGHSATVGLVWLVAGLPVLPGGSASAWLALGAAAGLTLERRLAAPAWVSAPATMALIGAFVVGLAGLVQAGWIPVEPFVFPAAAFALYSLLCGRDFSYLGLGVLGYGASVAALTGLAISRGEPWPALHAAMAAAWVFYVCYDLSMVVKRRKATDVLGGVGDLYRDLLNWVTYPLRVWSHWRGYRFQ